MQNKKIIGSVILILLLAISMYGGCSKGQPNKEATSALTAASNALSGETSYEINGDISITYTAEGIDPFNAIIPYQAKAEFQPAAIFWVRMDLTEYAAAMGASEGNWVLEAYTTNDTQYFNWAEEGWMQTPVESKFNPVEGASLMPEDLSQFFSASISKTTTTTTETYTEYNLTLDPEYLAEHYLNDAGKKDKIAGDMLIQINNQTGYLDMMRVRTSGTANAAQAGQDFGFALIWTLNFSNYGAVFGLAVPQEAFNAPPYQELNSTTN